MWTIFNPTDDDLEYLYKRLQYKLLAGETKKFPDDVGDYMVTTHGFLQVLKKDETQPKKTFSIPKNLDKVEEAEGTPIQAEDRRVKHPTSDPSVLAKSNFLATDQPEGYDDNKVGLNFREQIKNGKVVQIDRDGVEWYGSGVKVDNPFAIDRED